ncbi:MAG: hypothetical protein ACI3YZ_11245 [Prevotella sp.]
MALPEHNPKEEFIAFRNSTPYVRKRSSDARRRFLENLSTEIAKEMQRRANAKEKTS